MQKESDELCQPTLVELGMEFPIVTAVGGVCFEYVAVAGFEFFQYRGLVHHSGTAVVG